MGSTDWPAHECVNHFYGPPALFRADRFFPDTDCNIPPFFRWYYNAPYPPLAWLWAVGWHWAEHYKPWNSEPWWAYNVNVAGPGNNVRVEFSDNPQYSPPLDPWPHRAIFRVWTQRIPIGPRDEFWQVIYFNGPPGNITRATTWAWGPGGWFAHPLNPPGAVAPDGYWYFEPADCQPNWSPTQAPR